MRGTLSFTFTLGCLLFCLGALVFNHTTDARAHAGSGTAELPFDLSKGDYLEILTTHDQGLFIEVDDMRAGWIKSRRGLWYNVDNLIAIRKWVKPLPRLANSKREVAEANVKTLTAAVESYRMDNNLRLPVSLEELLLPNENNMNEPYLESEDVLLDPWGNPYVYQVSGGNFLILSLGADGKEGGEEENGDIASRPRR
jgi:general secretion pathway protein G